MPDERREANDAGTRDPESAAARVAVLMGGPSSEREVSLRSGRAIARALADAGYRVRAVEIDDERLPAEVFDCDVVFPALHGRFGEDGGVQRLLESAGLSYVGSDARASSAAFDKEETKIRLASVGIPTARWCVLGPEDGGNAIPFRPPLVVKPCREGSSIGITLVREPRELDSALREAFAHDSRVLVEERLEGRELTVGILGGRTLPIVEIVPPGPVFDFVSKYTKGRTQYHCPADLDSRQQDAVRSAALATWEVLQTRDLGRVDLILTREGRPCVLEMNTMPGFTETSLLPMAAAEAGMGFRELCSRLVETAAARNGTRAREEI